MSIPMEKTMNKMTHNQYIYFKDALSILTKQFIAEARPVHTATWQGVDISKRPEAQMMELLNVTFAVAPIGDRPPSVLAMATGCNMPWAEDHFQERVCGQPINPGIQWANWPWAHKAGEFLNKLGKFNHNYMERYWPRKALASMPPTKTAEEYDLGRNRFCGIDINRGIYHPYGDLNDVVDLLERDPLTRQAYLPVFFPEDTGAVHRERVPCTLGYHFIVRNDELHMVYYLRSCDFVRHMRDDIYLSVRLQQWVLEQLRERHGEYWSNIKAGSFTMHITSLHCFVNDFRTLKDATHIA